MDMTFGAVDTSFALPHLKGMGAIMHAFGVSRVTVVQWIKTGAPIYLVGKKYQASYADLWSWIKATHKPKNLSTPHRLQLDPLQPAL